MHRCQRIWLLAVKKKESKAKRIAPPKPKSRNAIRRKFKPRMMFKSIYVPQ